MKNKKGMNKRAEKLLSIWWFFVLGVVAGGIVIGVLIYSAGEIDVKEVEAEILVEKIIGCLTDNGYLIDFRGFNIFDDCGLDEDSFAKGSDFYFNVSIYDGEEIIYNFNEGDFSFEKNCEIKKKVRTKHFPECVERTENVLSLDNKNLKIVSRIGGKALF